MSKRLKRELSTLVEEKVISPDVANKIADYYAAKQQGSPSRIITIFGVFGALLISLGIILIIAHNWDNISKFSKTVFAFIPLIIGQIACLYAYLKKNESPAWKEGSAGFLFFAVAATIALISQIYNIPGNFSVFLLTWMLLTVPLVYIMQASLVAIFYIVGITIYGCEIGYWGYPLSQPFIYLFLLLLILPFYLNYFRKRNFSNSFHFYSWFLVVSVTILLGSFTNHYGDLMFVTYALLMAVFYQIGQLDTFKERMLIANPFALVGSVGTIIILLILSFRWYWEDLIKTKWELLPLLGSFEFIAGIVFATIVVFLLLKRHKHFTLSRFYLLELAAFVMLLLMLLAHVQVTMAIILANVLVLLVGVNTIAKGANADSLVILNYGLSTIAALTICRFFDTQITFVVRGILFVLVGAGFFVANYWFLKKRTKTIPE